MPGHDTVITIPRTSFDNLGQMVDKRLTSKTVLILLQKTTCVFCAPAKDQFALAAKANTNKNKLYATIIVDDSWKPVVPNITSSKTVPAYAKYVGGINTGSNPVGISKDDVEKWANTMA